MTRGSAGDVVLIGFAESLSAPEVAWNLVDAGMRVVCFSREGSRPALRRSRLVSIENIPSPERSASAALDRLCSVAVGCGTDAVMPLDDASLSLAAEAASRLGLRVIGPTGEQLQLALDKRLQLDAARRAGMAVLETATVETVDSLLELDDYPFILKPALAQRQTGDSFRRGRAYIIGNGAERAVAGHTWRGSEPMLAQPLLVGTGEGLCGVMVGDELRALSAHRRIRMMNPVGSGSSACEGVAADAQLAGWAEALLSEAGWSGIFMLEFLRDRAGTPWFMELNGRAWGSMALAVARGFDYPAWTARAALQDGFQVPRVPQTRTTMVCRHVGREVVHLGHVLRGPPSKGIQGWPSRAGALASVLRVRRSDRWYNSRHGERRVLAADTLETLYGAARRGR